MLTALFTLFTFLRFTWCCVTFPLCRCFCNCCCCCCCFILGLRRFNTESRDIGMDELEHELLMLYVR
uniref:Putative secreted peptide n=1 Tax=Anopheles braziliensis TaxID=58242 RepID=A0A2M3ZT63_9DIPT